ncbi:MAG: alkaline phosphatase family protein [Nitrososphaerales archaeon]
MPTSESEALLQKLVDNRLNEWMLKPDYNQYGLSNLAASIMKFFGDKHLKHKPIADPRLDEVLDGVENIILLLVDGLSYYQISGEVEKYLHASLNPTTIPITSTFPSTTTTALTTLNTGLTPQEHAIIGYTTYLKEIGVVLSLTNFAPSAAPESISLIQAGLDPSSILGVETIHSQLRKSGVKSIIMTRRIYRESPLTTMLGLGADIETYVGVSDIFVRMRKLLENSRTPTLLFPYWDGLDIAAHIYGHQSEEAVSELKNFLASMKVNLMEKINSNTAKKSALLITGDHGQVTFSPQEVLAVEKHPNLLNALHIPPTGDSRAACLYPKPEMKEKIIEYVETHLSQSFSIYETQHLLREGVFGLGEAKQNLLDRTGELILLPKRNGAIAYSYKPKYKEFDLKGGHGGLTPTELIVPLICKNLIR